MWPSLASLVVVGNAHLAASLLSHSLPHHCVQVGAGIFHMPCASPHKHLVECKKKPSWAVFSEMFQDFVLSYS